MKRKKDELLLKVKGSREAKCYNINQVLLTDARLACNKMTVFFSDSLVIEMYCHTFTFIENERQPIFVSLWHLINQNNVIFGE